MGGANGGNVASAIAVETIREQLLSGYDENLSKPNLKNLMINAINRANEEVHRVSLERPELHGMGTTVVLLVAAKGTLHVAPPTCATGASSPKLPWTTPMCRIW